LTFSLLLNLASACHPDNKSVLWGFISRYSPESTPENEPILDQLVGHALQYYQDFVAPNQQYRRPTLLEQRALEDLAETLTSLPPSSPSETIQTAIYDIGKKHNFVQLKDWFKTLYETLLGQSQGPRMGSFISLYGQEETVQLINKALARDKSQELPEK
jgi:lysyl-tRNA synthetase class 1